LLRTFFLHLSFCFVRFGRSFAAGHAGRSRFRAALRVAVPLRMTSVESPPRCARRRGAGIGSRRLRIPEAAPLSARVLAAHGLRSARIPVLRPAAGLWFLNTLGFPTRWTYKPALPRFSCAAPLDDRTRWPTVPVNRACQKGTGAALENAIFRRRTPAGPRARWLRSPGTCGDPPLEELSSLAPQGRGAPEAARRIHRAKPASHFGPRAARLSCVSRLSSAGVPSSTSCCCSVSITSRTDDPRSTSVLIKELGALYEAYAAGRVSRRSAISAIQRSAR
jgi:hypothetical protein